MKQWEYDPSKSIDKSISEKLKEFPREIDMTHSFFRACWNAVLRIFLKTFFRLTIIGEENLPKNQTYILIANHCSHLDSLCMSSAIPFHKISTTYSVAAKEFFFSSFGRSLFSSIFVNAIPFDRQKEKRKSLELCADLLKKRNQVLIMFPEGTRSENGEMLPFKKGIGILTAGTDHLVIPAYLKNAHLAWPKHSFFFRPVKVSLIIGKPMQFKALSQDQASYSQIAELLQSEVTHLKDIIHAN
jgi:1-acyl-sn-glycerol-3-phosphate acyltransferase